ncbi:MAG: hypothetical protein MUE85_21280 [Microscillaceae bacterium]|jgi:hypothetical protein|nr:hypothetical protein [Microscillaceae bacterium]
MSANYLKIKHLAIQWSLFFCFFIGKEQAFAQTSRLKERSMVTNKDVTITIQGNYREAKRTPTRPNYTTLYRRDANKLLLGNTCAEIVMQDYGMKYVVVPKSFEMSSTKYFFHNFFARTKLLFRNGPGWKNRMYKKVQKCRQKTGDYVF